MEMNRQILNHIESLLLGALAYVEWFDASVGKSLRAGGVIDVPVKSWGRLLGCFGREKQAHHSGSKTAP